MKKQVGRDLRDEKIAKEFLKLMPRFPRTFKWLLKKVERFDYRSPTTFISEIKAEVAKCAPALNQGNVGALRPLWKLLSELPLKQQARKSLDDIVKTTKSEASKDPRYSLLLKLMGEADQRVPLISIIVSMRHGDPIESLGPQCAPYDLLEQADRERGESRATFVLRALGETCEALYRPYLITIWALSFFKEGEVPPVQIPSTGNLVKDTYRRLSDYPGLVEPDAGWMRNSAIHNPRKYILEKDALEMWDKSVEPRIVPVGELLAMVKRMYQISGVTIQRVSQLYMFRNLFGEIGLLDGFVESFPVLLSSDENEIQQVEARFTAKAEEMFRPMSDFFEAQAPPPGP
jgi:hypothetical protein